MQRHEASNLILSRIELGFKEAPGILGGWRRAELWLPIVLGPLDHMETLIRACAD